MADSAKFAILLFTVHLCSCLLKSVQYCGTYNKTSWHVYFMAAAYILRLCYVCRYCDISIANTTSWTFLTFQLSILFKLGFLENVQAEQQNCNSGTFSSIFRIKFVISFSMLFTWIFAVIFWIKKIGWGVLCRHRASQFRVSGLALSRACYTFNVRALISEESDILLI